MKVVIAVGCALLVSMAFATSPVYSTFSLCAIDPDTGESGVVVTTRVPFVGRAVPWARAGVGAVATQSWTVVEYGIQGLDLIEQGVEPEEAIRRLLSDDEGRELRQLGAIDMQGRTSAFTGKENGPWAGSRQGKNYTVQGNVLVGPDVVNIVGDHFESTEGSDMPLAERMILALEAGQMAGGDKRWGYLQSAAIRIADPNDTGRGGDRLSVVIDVGEHAAPVQELKRIYYTTERTLGYRMFSEIRGTDVVELKRRLKKLGYYRKDGRHIHASPEFDVDRQLSRTDPEQFQRLVADFGKIMKTYLDSFGVYDLETVLAVDAFRKDHGIDFEGTPRGLVDATLVKALDEALRARQNEDSSTGSNGR